MHTITVVFDPVDTTLTNHDPLDRLGRCPRCQGIEFQTDELLHGASALTLHQDGALWSEHTELHYDTQATIAITCAGCGWRAALVQDIRTMFAHGSVTRDGVSVTIVRPAGIDEATVVQLETAREPDVPGHALRVYLNGHAIYTGVAYRPHN